MITAVESKIESKVIVQNNSCTKPVYYRLPEREVHAFRTKGDVGIWRVKTRKML